MVTLLLRRPNPIERQLFEKEHSKFLIKLSDHHTKVCKLRIEKQELESFEIQQRAEKEILSVKESEISNTLKQLVFLKNDLTRERETIEKLVHDNSSLCNQLEFQKISVLLYY